MNRVLCRAAADLRGSNASAAGSTYRRPTQLQPGDVVRSPTSGGEAQLTEENHPREIVQANAGFIFAFSIDAALDASRKNPVGPSIDQRTK